ncbi:MAG: amidohydrolase family protein [Planctomycetes bacterium]|nr:amidohydrolase family protein [Planctomycetota bacterium]
MTTRHGGPALLGALLLVALLAGERAPAVRADDPGHDDLVAIRAGRVITVSGEEFAPGVVIVRDGRVEAVGARVEVPRRARVIDARDGVVMPGLVSARTRLGLGRYDRGGNQAHLSAHDELLPERGRFDAALAAGFVALGVVPSGGGVPGQAVAVRPLDDAPAAAPGAGTAYVRARLADLPGDKRVLRDAFRAAKAAIDKEAQARAEWEKKQRPTPPAGQAPAGQAPQGQPPPRPAPPAPAPPQPAPAAPAAGTAPVSTAVFVPPPVPDNLKPFVAWLKKAPDAPRLLVELGSASDWVHLGDLRGRFELPTLRYFVSNGSSTDWHRVVEAVGAEKPLVVVFPRLSFEANTRTRVHVPAELARAGARLAFAPLTDDADGYRRHLEAAALAHRDGVSREEALKALTLHPAEVLGLEGELGAIEKGRRADLVILDGDPLEAGARVTQVLLDGKPAWKREEVRR